MLKDIIEGLHTCKSSQNIHTAHISPQLHTFVICENKVTYNGITNEVRLPTNNGYHYALKVIA